MVVRINGDQAKLGHTLYSRLQSKEDQSTVSNHPSLLLLLNTVKRTLVQLQAEPGCDNVA